MLGNPLAGEVLDVLGGIEGVGDLVERLRNYIALRDRHRNGMISDRAGRPRRRRTKPAGEIVPPEEPPGPNGPDVNVAAAGQSWQSPIESLLDRTSTDRVVTEFLNRLLNEPALVTNPMLAMLRDVHAAQRYYNARGAEDAQAAAHARGPSTHTAPGARLPRAGGVGRQRPTLARTLGFVVDVRVDDLDALRAAGTIRCDVIIDGAEEYLSPETRCTTVGSVPRRRRDQPVAGGAAGPG